MRGQVRDGTRLLVQAEQAELAWQPTERCGVERLWW
ncbi:hypothetical protein EV651_11142 [Kribbella sp. VKM Ac-2571]|nr:hypothetical protein EV651_11142 [Kribbella sp. VKM Ac-2571]